MLYNIITLDGPVGVGKSAVARQIAQRLGWRHVDTGAMYRAVTLAAMRRNLDLC
ncbi:MAG TPA: (d)CMP kinase, partial [Candidatus Sumerlaeia bacterium]|nr:(d)CMP kinase [Candidatus Sumerlaeia bacterium]